MLFGAIGGTIPDLDVFVASWLYGNEIDAMLFHRWFMHSIFFSILAAFLFGWLTHKLYDKGKRRNTTTQKDWILLFFWSLFTHPILDSFTPYGTQLFAPFTNYRVALNSIAVADFGYTVPFLMCLLVVMFFRRQDARRRLWLRLGIGLSSAYLLFTVVNKIYIDHTFESSLEEQKVSYSRFSTQPSILNNILWYGIAETDNSYEIGFYSLLDQSSRFSDWKTIPKKRLADPKFDNDLSCLSWFSNGYFNIESTSEGNYLYYDLRYPLVKTKEGYKPVFNLLLYEKDDRLDMKPFEPETEDFEFTMSALWERVKGR